MADKSEQEIRLEVYRAYLEDLGRLGGRHETLRQFYLSVISALAAFLALAGKDGLFQGVREVATVVGLVGALICLAWCLHMGRFADLFSAKAKTLRQMESGLPSTPFALEDQALAGMSYPRLTRVDQGVGLAFIVLFAALVYVKRF
jgi:hypothetical protein